MKKWLWLVSLLGIVGLFLLPSMPALAIAGPDNPPQVSDVYVYEDLLEDGDAGVLVDYYLDYASVPSETVTDAYLVVFVDTDGTTQIRAVSPYTYVNSGYGRGLAWIYFSADDVTTYGITSASVADYKVWLVGNPTLGWSGDPPKTTTGISYWQPTGSDTAVLLALQVLDYADVLELIWALDLIEETALGNRLTSAGASYFVNVIANLRTIAPSAFSAGQYNPVMEDIDTSTSFGATMTNGSGNVTGSPITLTEGSNTVTATVAGTFTLELNRGTSGNVTDGTGIVTDSPVDLVYGTNTITVPGGGTGTLTVVVNLIDTQTAITDTVTGTALDLTTVATRFGMSPLMFSGLVWLIITVVICASVYRVGQREGVPGGGKVVMVVFDICIIGGAVLGLLSLLVAALMFIGFGAFTGYIIFFRQANV